MTLRDAHAVLICVHAANVSLRRRALQPLQLVGRAPKEFRTGELLQGLCAVFLDDAQAFVIELIRELSQVVRRHTHTLGWAPVYTFGRTTQEVNEANTSRDKRVPVDR